MMEDPEEQLREAHKMMMDNARNLRGIGMMAGLDGGVSGQEGGIPKPAWKKP